MVASARFLAEGFLLGIATGHLCLVTCGPVYAPFLMQSNFSNLKYLITLLKLSIGRFITYVSIGALAGLLGHHVSEFQREYFTLSSYVLFSVFLIISAFRSSKCEKGCNASRWSRFSEMPIILGMVTGINVCPSFLIAFTRSFELSGPLAGAFFFMTFFVGTNIFLLPLSFVGMLGKQFLFRKIARISAVVIAGWFIVSSGQIAYSLVQPHFDNRPVISLLDNTPLYIILDKEIAEKAARIFASKRNGPVHIVSSSRQLPKQNCYVITEESQMSKEDNFRSADRFVAVIAKNEEVDSTVIESVVNFLGKFHFRFNTAKGDIFYIR